MDCPLCGRGALETIHRSPSSGVAKCLGCGLMFRDPYRGCVASKCAGCADRCIDRLADPAFLEARLRLDGRKAQRLRSLAGADFRDLRVLEIGSGLGCLAAHIADAARAYLGTEPSPLFYGIQLERFPGLAGRVVNALLPDARLQGRFDLAIAVDVLQFADRPQGLLKSARGYLRDGGLLYLEVPNESSLRLRAWIRRALGLYRGEPVHHGHINFFTRESLRFLIQSAGLRIERMEQLSIAGDEDRMFLTMKAGLPFHLKAISRVAKLTKADLLAGLGNLACLCRR